MLRYSERRTPSGLEITFKRLFESLRLVKHRVCFETGGIAIVTRIFGFAIRRRWFDRASIYGFGYAVNGHSQMRMLRFDYEGDRPVILAKDGTKGEVEAFIQHLNREGFCYDSSRQRPDRRNSNSIV